MEFVPALKTLARCSACTANRVKKSPQKHGVKDVWRQVYAFLITICVLTKPVVSAPSSLEMFRSSLGFNRDNDTDGPEASPHDDTDKTQWRKSLLDDVPPAQLRWRTPCAGSSPAHGVDGLFDSVETAAIAPHEHFSVIALKAMEHHGKVISLMSKYINERFHDPLFHTQLDTFRLDGMPDVPQVNTETMDPRGEAGRNAMYTAYEFLARVAVFLEQARIDEIMYEYGNKNFAAEILDIEEQGIYWMLCQLQIALHAHELTIDSQITREVMRQEFRDMTDRATRHNRDFIILRDFAKVLNYIKIEFTVLSQQAELDKEIKKK